MRNGLRNDSVSQVMEQPTYQTFSHSKHSCLERAIFGGLVVLLHRILSVVYSKFINIQWILCPYRTKFDTALSWALANAHAKWEVDKMNGSRYLSHIQTEIPCLIPFLGVVFVI